MAGGVCTVGGCGNKAVATHARECDKCKKTIHACQGCTAREVNMRRALYCTMCAPKPKKPRRQ